MQAGHKVLIAAGVAALALTGVGLVDCAAPTQIVIEIRSDVCVGYPEAGKPRFGVAIGTAPAIDAKDPAAFRDDCEDAPKGGVGTLTIYPSGANDAEVAIKVMAAVDRRLVDCRAPEYAGCIVHRRVMRFIPNTTQRITVRLQLACLDRVCGAQMTCDNGVCKQEADILPDGGTKDDAAISEAGIAEGGVVMDAGGDACALCNGTCTSTGCAVDCKGKVCTAADYCSPTLPCTITCDGTGDCNDIRCTTSEKCTVNCGMAKTSCNKVTCNAKECDVTCAGNNSCDGDGGILLNASTKASLTCNGDNACQTASCNSPDCNLDCKPGPGMMKSACPSPAPCDGGCDNWNNPGGG